MKIVFDGARARFVGYDNPTIALIKEHALKWIDKSIEQNNIYQRGRYQDPVKYCYNKKDKSFPTGLLPRVVEFLQSTDISYFLEFDFECKTLRNKDPIPDWAFDHQRDIVDCLVNYRRVICSSPTASGKSTAISLIAEKFREFNTLIVLHQNDLIYDLKDSLENYLDEEVGIVVGSKKHVWKDITVAGCSLLRNRLEEYKEELEKVDLLIFDECHHYANDTGEKISNACKNTSYRLGLSATPDQQTGANLVLEGVIGSIYHRIPDNIMVELGVIHKPDVHFVEIPDPKLNLECDPVTGKPPRPLVVEHAIINYDYRNELACELINQYLKHNPDGGGVLVLVEDVKNKHGIQIVGGLATYDIESKFIWGGTKVDKRQEVIEEFKSGDLPVLVATRILNEGKDVPSIELGINLAGGSGERGIVQKLGRTLRKDKTGRKTRSIFIDFMDAEPYYLANNSRKRMRHLNARFPGCAKVTELEDLYDLLSNV